MNMQQAEDTILILLNIILVIARCRFCNIAHIETLMVSALLALILLIQMF